MITVRLFGAARAAAGVSEVRLAASSLDELLACLATTYGEDVERVLARCSFLVDGIAVPDRTSAHRLDAGSTVDVLPPFAGG